MLTSQLVGIPPRQKQECEEMTAEHYGSSSGCFMCFALGNPRWADHIPNICWFKDKLLQDPETYYKERRLKKSDITKETMGLRNFERTSYQSQTLRRPRGDRQRQGLQGQAELANHSQQMHPQGQYSSFQTQADHSQAMPQMQQASTPMNQMF